MFLDRDKADGGRYICKQNAKYVLAQLVQRSNTVLQYNDDTILTDVNESDYAFRIWSIGKDKKYGDFN